ncbi:FitA-like ribbon-helix-helix domain-containing protein [Nitrosomonas europaea]
MYCGRMNTMPSITIRNVPDVVRRVIRIRAAMHA